MKAEIIAVAIAMAFNQAMAGSKEPQPSARSDEGKRVFSEVVNLSQANNLLDLAEKLPEIDPLWEKDPIGYLHAMEFSVRALVTSNDPNITAPLIKALDDAMAKRCPDDTEAASFYFLMKSDIIGYGSRSTALQANGKSLLMTADLLGEIRSKKITGYQRREIPNPGQDILEAAGVQRVADLPTATQKDAVAKAIEENRKNEQMDRLQGTLSILDGNMSRYLIISTQKSAVDSVAQKASAGDIRGLTDSLPDLENLWKQHPTAYLDAIKISIPALIKSGDPEAKNAALIAFPKLMEKTCPADTASAAAYIATKFFIIGNYFNFKEVREDKDRLLMIADFLHEVRSLRIPNYQNQGTNRPGREIFEAAGVHYVEELPTQTQKDAVAAAVKKNEEDLKMNQLQTFLRSADPGITFMLMGYAKSFSVKDPANRSFHEELAKRAKFTQEEIKELNQPQ